MELGNHRPQHRLHRTMLRWLLPTIWVLAVVGGCADRSDDADTPAEQNAADDKPTVALIMKSLANEFFATMEAGARQHQQTHADQYTLIANGIKDERDLTRQVGLVEEMVNRGVDAIVIAPADSKALVPALRRALEAGVVVVNIDNRLDAEVLAQEDISIPFVGPDNRMGARVVGDYLAGYLSAGDHVAMLEGIPTSLNAQQRKAGFTAAMEAAGVEIVDSQAADWEMSRANTIASAMLSEHPELKAILAANDSMALGALAAIKSAGREGQVMVVGFDNITAVQRAIGEGDVLATADQYGDQLAVFGIEVALQLLEDPAQNPDDVETPVDLITAETLQP